MTGCWNWSVCVLAGILTLSSETIIAPATLAQLAPDGTLGVEGSLVTPNVLIRGVPGDRIDGGTRRGNNLFHSFQQFNVEQNQRVYFANPVGVESILTRVTGANPSRILGTLGVDGGANLFLINPQGILFGANARLDIAGSFVASTARSLDFGNGLQYSATDPQAPPLLAVNVRPGLQYGTNPATIANLGNLTVGQDLTLAGGNLLLQGQLSAGRDLTLHATDTVQIRDSATAPFIASAGQNLLVQGDRAVDIFALNHPSSGFWAGGDLVLRSGGAIAGDAHYTAGGNFQIEQLDGSLGEWSSPTDPVIRSAGNVSFTNYTGASLHIFAGGAVTANNITVNGVDGVNGIVETVTLSNGTPLQVNGRTRATLDIRAGTTAFGTPAGLTGAPSPTGLTFPTTPVTNANITITGAITNTQPNALVILTNQYQPNAALAGNITVGNISTNSAVGNSAVVLDSRGSITTNGRINTSGTNGNGGAVTMLAGGDITINTPATATAFGTAILTNGQLGGAITFSSGGTISVIGNGNRDLFPISSNTATTTAGLRGGDLTFTGRVISFTNAANTLIRNTRASGSGNVVLNATQAIILDNSEVDVAVFDPAAIGSPLVTGSSGDLIVNTPSLTLQSNTNTPSALLAATFGTGNTGNVRVNANTVSLNNGQISTFVADPRVRGNAGDVRIDARSITVIRGGQIFSTTVGQGNGGNVIVNATDSIVLSGEASGGIFSAISSQVEVGGTGRGGNTTITTGLLSASNGAQIRSSTRGPQNAGSISITADRIVFDGVGTNATSINSSVLAGGTGSSGDIVIQADSIAFTNGAIINASTSSTNPQSSAGNILITADTVTFDGTAPSTFSPTTPQAFGNGTSIRVGTNGVALGGTLDVTANSLSLSNGAQFRSNTQGAGAAGNVVLRIADSIVISGAGSGVFASTTAGSTGNGGTVIIDPQSVVIRDGGRIAVDSRGSGTGGSIFLQADRLTLSNQAAITAETVSSQGGNITLQIRDLLLLRYNSLISATAGIGQGSGDGGNITIDSPFIVAVARENSDITANAFTGRGGNIIITTQGLFGIQPRPRLTEFSDITASSEFGLQGVITINTPDLDPSRGLTALPVNLVDASNLVAQNCSAQGAIATKQGEFVITGRGGLPPGPADALTSQGVWQDLRPPVGVVAQAAQSSGQASTTEAIVEAQGWVIAPDGQINLIAQATAPSPHGTWLTPAACQH